MEEYTRELEQLLVKCDLKEDETQTFVRYLSGLDDQIAHVIELHPYSSLDDLSFLAYKVEQQRKAKGKSALSKPYTWRYSSQRPSNTFPRRQNTQTPRPAPPLPKTPLKEPTPNRKTKASVSCAKAWDTLLSNVPKREFSP